MYTCGRSSKLAGLVIRGKTEPGGHVKLHSLDVGVVNVSLAEGAFEGYGLKMVRPAAAIHTRHILDSSYS